MEDKRSMTASEQLVVCLCALSGVAFIAQLFISLTNAN